MTNFIYRREHALSNSLCRSFIETFETDTENQSKGSVNVRGKVVDDYPGNLRGLRVEVTAGESGDISRPYLCIYEKT